MQNPVIQRFMHPKTYFPLRACGHLSIIKFAEKILFDFFEGNLN